MASLLPTACDQRKADVADSGAVRSSNVPRPACQVSPDPIRLGSLDVGQSVEMPIHISNASDRVVAIKRVEISCPCVSIENLPDTIGIGEKIVCKVAFDPSHEPNFRGLLNVQISAYSNDSEVCFQAVLVLEVAERKDPGRAE